MTEMLPKPPKWIVGVALERWDQIWTVVDRERVRPEIHADSVAIYCQAYSSFCEANENINAIGLVNEIGNRIIANPYVAIRATAAKTMLELAPDLGLSAGSPRMSWPTDDN